MQPVRPPSGPSAATLILSGDTVELEPRAVTPDAIGSERYEDLGLIGMGGMGEVRRVRDRHLNRVLAMKILHGPVNTAALARFLEEAQATAQLQHPNIVPVHDLGRMEDGRAWFTMKEVQGRTLSDLIAEVHGKGDSSGWSLRRLVTAFHAVCQAVSYAHERGVVHRDLKPDNTMIGAYGEVYVLDWGLAKIMEPPEEDHDSQVRSGRTAAGTRLGQVAGTPAYMAETRRSSPPFPPTVGGVTPS